MAGKGADDGGYGRADLWGEAARGEVEAEQDAHEAVAAGRPISRDTLRAQMRIGRDRAGAIIAIVRAEAAAEVESGQLRAAS